MSSDIEFLILRDDSIVPVRFVSPLIEFKRHWIRTNSKHYAVQNCSDDCPLCEQGDTVQRRWSGIVIAQERIKGPEEMKVFQFGITVKRQLDAFYSDIYDNAAEYVLGDPDNDLDWGMERCGTGRGTRFFANAYSQADVLSVEQRENASFYYDKMKAAFPPLTRTDVLNMMGGIFPDVKKNVVKELKKKCPKNRWTALEII